MVQKGLALRFKEKYTAEIDFARSLGFDFFQIWFYNGLLSANTADEPKERNIKNAGFPIILHVVFDMPDYEKYGAELFRLLEYFDHKEVIIHPICKSEPITDETIFTLESKIRNLHRKLKKNGIKLYVENNSIIDGFFNTVTDMKVVFDANPDIGLLLDLAHINNVEHLKEIVKMRFPECMHIADKRFGVPHEHLALGDGDMDFDIIFKELLVGYNGKIILEAVESNEDINQSKQIIDKLFPNNKCV
ncbi:MAG: sugar phosphate isomerase/epimerase [Oscillospiraceae bacterium]|nr:sugar phosphate isomerase/epimerase [Oscillospiraceae bacterium]